MTRWLSRIALFALVATTAAAPALADLAKLDARVRVTLGRLRAGVSADELHGGRLAATPAGDLDVFILGAATRAQLERTGARVRTALPGVCTASVPLGAVESLAALPDVTAIRGAAPVEPALSLSVPTTNAEALRGPGPDFVGLNGEGVLIATVDTGVDYDHDDFKDAAGNTRIVSLWDQTDPFGAPPAGFFYGSEWSAADLNSGLAAEIDFPGHGTHVLGIAAGDGSATGGSEPAFRYVGMAPKADLLVVKTNFLTTGVVDGVAYAMSRAAALGKNVAVNLSLGTHFGPHDGTSAFETALATMTGPGRIICAAASNERGHPRHAEVFAAGAGTSATLTVGGSGPGASLVIDGYYESSENLDVQITTPSGAVVGPASLGNPLAAYPGTPTSNGNVYVENGLTLTSGWDREVYIEIRIPSPNPTGASMNGTWTITLVPVALGPANGEVDLWRAYSTGSVTADFVAGSQADEELVSEPGNAEDIITVASWTSNRYWTDCNYSANVSFPGAVGPGNLSPFSSPGPTRDGRQKPDIAAPGSAIASATTFDVPPSCPAAIYLSPLLPDGLQHRENQGTSMAAPHVTGAAALLMQKFGPVPPAFVRSYLGAHAVRDPFTGDNWNKDWGNGKLFLGDLTDPAVTVLVPNGGETLDLGASTDLRWVAPDRDIAVDLLLSRDGGGTFEAIAVDLPNTGAYAWTVDGSPTGSALLRVVARDAGGIAVEDVSDRSFIIAGGVTGAAAAAPSGFALATLSPNPTRGSARVEYVVGREADVRLAVLDVQGRVVATLAEGRRAPGPYQAVWDGRAGNGPAASGLYFVRYRTPAGDFTRRVVMAR